jgi:hypothetical protein
VATAVDLIPEVSTTPGAISAFRADDAGSRRYLQVTNSLNPGNSGGPLIDRDGFVVGVIRMRLLKADGIGFAIPVNDVKDFFESRGLDQLMPVRRLRLGAFHDLNPKGLGLRLPEGIADNSPFRSRVQGDAPATGIGLRIDRVLSSWTGRQVEEALTRTATFEPIAIAGRGREISGLGPPSGRSTIVGGAVISRPAVAREMRMDYAILDLGAEKLVARYVGSAEAMAYNESVLRESLLTLEGRQLLGANLAPAETLEWRESSGANGQRAMPMPAGWIVSGGGPTACTRLPGTSTVAMSSDDFTLSIRAGIWTGEIPPETAAAGCSATRGALGAGSYRSTAEWLGESYVLEGVFARIATGQLVQLEVLATAGRSAYARALLAEWLKRVSE